MIDSKSVEIWAHDLLAAWHSNSPKPARNLVDLPKADAYVVQKKLVALRGSEITGYKSGLTNKAIQVRYETDEPAAGVLFKDARLPLDVAIATSDFIKPRIETEVGLVLRTDITDPITSAGELKSHLAFWRPMIELVDMGFLTTPLVTDMIAANIVASRYIQTDYCHDVETANDATVHLFKNGELLHEGKATDALGDQLEAATWIVNHMLSQGYSMKAGQVLMTGALGVTHPAEPGKYHADYGEFGSIEFEFI